MSSFGGNRNMWSLSSISSYYIQLSIVVPKTEKFSLSYAGDASIQVIIISAAAEVDFNVSVNASLQSRSRIVCGKRERVSHQGDLALCWSPLVPSALHSSSHSWLTFAVTQSKATQQVFHGPATFPRCATRFFQLRTKERVCCFSHESAWFLFWEWFGVIAVREWVFLSVFCIWEMRWKYDCNDSTDVEKHSSFVWNNSLDFQWECFTSYWDRK